MSRISRLDRSEVTPDIAALYDKAFAQRGNVPNMFRVMAHRPGDLRHHAGALCRGAQHRHRLHQAQRADHRPHQPGECDSLLPGQPHHSGQRPGMDRRSACPPGRLATRDDFTPAEKAALRLAETVTRDAHAVTDEQFAELRSFYSEGEIVELALRHRPLQLLQPLQQRFENGAHQTRRRRWLAPAVESPVAR